MSHMVTLRFGLEVRPFNSNAPVVAPGSDPALVAACAQVSHVVPLQPGRQNRAAFFYDAYVASGSGSFPAIVPARAQVDQAATMTPLPLVLLPLCCRSQTSQ
jgi:hypothetical protein